jgi:hypothetical protein
MPIFTLSGCLLEITDNIVSAEYYGANSFRLGYAGMWEDDREFTGISVRNDTGVTCTITERKDTGWSSSYSTNYVILYVYPDWIPGELITVSCSATGKECSFRVPKEEQ